MNCFRILVMIITIALFAACSKTSSNPTPPTVTPETKLQVVVKDQAGNLVSGATVKIYSSLVDFIAGLGGYSPIATGTTNTSGAIVFGNASTSIQYYIYAEKNCNNNYVAKTYGPFSYLTANITNTATCTIAPSGTMTFNNTSSNPYAVYLNGVLAINRVEGGATQQLKWQATGAYSIRVLQLSGYLISPTDKTYNGSLLCGGNLTTTFP